LPCELPGDASPPRSTQLCLGLDALNTPHRPMRAILRLDDAEDATQQRATEVIAQPRGPLIPCLRGR
jgi:hypothetical protein